MSFPLVSLGDFVKIARNGITSEKIQSGTKYVGLENIDSSGNFVDVKGVDAGELASSKFLFTKKQVLFGKLRPYLKKIARPDFDGICSTDILPLLPSKEIDRDYLFHTLRRQSFVDDVSSLSSGANLPRISPKVLSEMQIPLPPLEEQRRIATILDKADALRAQRRAAIGKLDELLQSVFIEMFEQSEETDWDEMTVADVVDPISGMRTGPFGSQLLHSEFVSKGVAVLGIDNVVSNEFRWGERRFIMEEKYRTLKRYTVRPGDVLITIMGTNGRCAVVPKDIPLAINTKHLCCITLDKSKCLPEFLHSYFLRHSRAKRYLGGKAKGAIMAGLNMGIIKAMPIQLPALKRQKKFVDIAARIEAQKQIMQLAAEKTDSLFASLQQRAFSGKL